MKKLVEMIGRKNGYSEIDIHNQYEKINNNIEQLVEGQINLSIEHIILISIQYSLSFKKQREYESIINYVNEIL